MTGIEKAYCNATLRALNDAYTVLCNSKIDEILRRITDLRQDLELSKPDTLSLDAIVEITISKELKEFDQHAILITEERGADANPLGSATPASERGLRTFFVSDPVDRTSHLSEFLRRAEKPLARVRDVLHHDNARAAWESFTGGPAAITGATSAITCVRRGLPVCAAVLNFITQELAVACDRGVFRIPVLDMSSQQTLDELDIDTLADRGTTICFPTQRSVGEQRFVTYVGKRGYEENLVDSGLLPPEDIKKQLVYDQPGGPARVLYLSDLQPSDQAVTFILANGEKIGEWIHWLPFVRFATTGASNLSHPLRLYELFHQRPWTKNGILMSAPPVYSVFQPVPGGHGRFLIDVDKLKALPNPSRYRSTLILTTEDNLWARILVEQHGHRPVVLFGD